MLKLTLILDSKSLSILIILSFVDSCWGWSNNGERVHEQGRSCPDSVPRRPDRIKPGFQSPGTICSGKSKEV